MESASFLKFVQETGPTSFPLYSTEQSSHTVHPDLGSRAKKLAIIYNPSWGFPEKIHFGNIDYILTSG